MHKLEFLTSEEFDLAVALLSNAWLDKAGISNQSYSSPRAHSGHFHRTIPGNGMPIV